MNIPHYISSNLRQEFPLRDYQKIAIGNLVNVESIRSDSNFHGLYHMATGSGKTMVMAGCILHLYKLGYRNFIFFVNSKSILEKTRYNFLQSTSRKYLFDDEILIDGRRVTIREIDNIDQSDSLSINIIFTTIQKMHSSFANPSENAMTLEELRGQKIVLISDESHHINVNTKSSNNKTDSWEDTIDKIKNVSNQYVLLEYTATMPLDHPAVSAKYHDKIIYNYPLKKYRDSGYSKWVYTHYSELEPMSQILEAIILSQLRKMIFAHYDIIAKPVILIKSTTIKASATNKQNVLETLNKLSDKYLNDIISKSTLTLDQIKKYTNTKNLLEAILDDFNIEHIISVDSKNDSESHQILINDLENPLNPIRMIFAVDKLNEGWDVLNLFDIVRLSSKSKTTKINKKSTIAEAQLIGRGARYYPFHINKNQERYRRKYDNIDHPLSLCEQLYFHADYIPDYIQQMEQTLLDLDIVDLEKVKYLAAEHPTSVNVKLPKSITISGYSNGKISLQNIPNNIFRKAINQNAFFRFDHLSRLIPTLKSIFEIKNIEIIIDENKVSSNRSSVELLHQTAKILAEIQKNIESQLS